MREMVNTLCRFVVSALRSKRDLVLENAALRHQLMVLQRQSKAPRIKNRDRLFWITLLRLWPDWRGALSLVQPATVVRWHRNGFRAYWRWKSRTNGGRPRIDREVRELIRDMWAPNPTWGKLRIRAELAKICIAVSDSTVTFRVLHVFLVMSHDRRRILHFNVTTSPWQNPFCERLIGGGGPSFSPSSPFRNHSELRMGNLPIKDGSTVPSAQNRPVFNSANPMTTLRIE